jgi:hypothetical protein
MKTPMTIESHATLRSSPGFWKIRPRRAFLPLLAVFAAAVFFAGSAWGQETNRYTKVANQLVALINAGDYAGIQTNFNKAMDAALPLEKSGAFFSGLTRQMGKFEKLGEPQSVGGAMVYPAKFEKGTLDMQLVLEGRRELIAGLMFKPHTAAKPTAQAAQTERYLKMANQIKDLINAGDYAGIQKKFSKELDAALPLEKSSEFFKGLSQQVGKIQKFGQPQFVGEGMLLPTEFEKGALDMQLALDARGQIAGIAFMPQAAR